MNRYKERLNKLIAQMADAHKPDWRTQDDYGKIATMEFYRPLAIIALSEMASAYEDGFIDGANDNGDYDEDESSDDVKNYLCEHGFVPEQ